MYLTRLVWYKTLSDNKYEADTERVFTYLGEPRSIWQLWYHLTQELKARHVEVYALDGRRLAPEEGLYGMY